MPEIRTAPAVWVRVPESWIYCQNGKTYIDRGHPLGHVLAEIPETATVREALPDVFNAFPESIRKVGDGQDLLDALAEILPVYNAAHEAMVRAKVAEEIEAHAQELMGAAVDRVMSDDPGGQTAAMRAAAIKSVARFVRGDRP